MSEFGWVPLTEDEMWRNAGLGPMLDAAASGDAVAALLIERLRTASAAMQPEIDRLKAQIEREWMQGSASSADGLSVLLSE